MRNGGQVFQDADAWRRGSQGRCLWCRADLDGRNDLSSFHQLLSPGLPSHNLASSPYPSPLSPVGVGTPGKAVSNVASASVARQRPPGTSASRCAGQEIRNLTHPETPDPSVLGGVLKCYKYNEAKTWITQGSPRSACIGPGSGRSMGGPLIKKQLLLSGRGRLRRGWLVGVGFGVRLPDAPGQRLARAAPFPVPDMQLNAGYEAFHKEHFANPAGWH